MRAFFMLSAFVILGCNQMEKPSAAGDFSATYRDVTRTSSCVGAPRVNSLYGTWHKQKLGDKGDMIIFQYVISNNATQISKTCIVPGGQITTVISVPSYVTTTNQFVITQTGSHTETSTINGQATSCSVSAPAGSVVFRFVGNCVDFITGDGSGPANYFIP